MADSNSSYVNWILSLQIPWLVSGPIASAYARVFGTVLDNSTTVWQEAVKARMPQESPSDALPYIAIERNLIDGYGETEQHYRDRLQAIWKIAPFYGTSIGILLQLYYQGYTDGYLIGVSGNILSI